MPLVLGTTLLFALLKVVTPAQASNATPAAPASSTVSLANAPLPADPKELLALARKVNGLTGADVQPWHLKASFEVFDFNGKSKDKGTFEEWWVSDRQYKLTYTSYDFNQTEYGTDHGLFHSGDDGWPTSPLGMLRLTLLDPFPPESQLEDWAETSVQRKFGESKLDCIALQYKDKNGEVAASKRDDDYLPSFCFDSSKPVLRFSNTGRQVNDTLYNQIVLFRNRYLSKDILISLLGKSYLAIHLEKIESLALSDRANLPPATDVRQVATTRIQTLPFGTAVRPIKKVPPQYPADAKRAGIQGQVVLEATIGKDGLVKEVRPLGGPIMLQAGAENAVRQWVYQPYLVNGEAVEVDTQVTVVFALSAR